MKKLLAALLFTSAAFASDIHVVPLGPTTTTPIEVHYRSICQAVGGHSVTREGSLIRITALDPHCIIVLPIPTVEKVQLPEPLPVGEYRVEVRLEGDTQNFASTEFVVRNGGPVPFEVHPSAVPFGGSQIPVRIDGVTCGTEDCSDIIVRVDGQIVEHQAGDFGAVWFIAPPHEPGLVDVTVQKSDFISPSPGALYYFDGPDPSVFETILFPVLFSSAGAHGSQWVSEARMSNPRPWYVHTADGEVFQPRQIKQASDGHPHGLLLRVPRAEAPDFAFALRVRDVARQAEGLGTHVPVVRERDFVHGDTIRLLDVPLDPRYRVKVRIYMIEPAMLPTGGFVAIPRGDALLRIPFNFTRASETEPYYAEVDLPLGVIDERIKVEVEMPLDAIGWAFASITNNETQEVTIVAPY